MMDYDDRYGHMNGSGTDWLVILLLSLLVLAAIVALIVYAISRDKSGSAAGTLASSDGLRILDERLARGEITPAEYRERRDAMAR